MLDGRPLVGLGLLDHTRHPAPGSPTGWQVAAGAYRLLGGGRPADQAGRDLQPNDAVESVSRGGGYGSPRARDPETVVADCRGVRLDRAARALYGVVVAVGRADALVRTRASYELDLRRRRISGGPDWKPPSG